MAKIFIDTNIFLDFYRAASDRLSLFEELKKLGKSLIISEQGYREFQRNRVSELTKLSNEISRSSSISIYTTAVVREMNEHKETIQLQSQIRELGKKLKAKIDAMLDPEPGCDPVLDAYEDLTKSGTFIETKEEFVTKAKIRKILGTPPISPDRHSVCDELLWEELIGLCHEDLIIVTKDKTFIENKRILRNEFSDATNGKTLTIATSVSEALNILGSTSDRLEATEAEIGFNLNQPLSNIADHIMEIAIRKSSPIVTLERDGFLRLTIKNVGLNDEYTGERYLLDAINELIKMDLINDDGSGVYELTEKGHAYQPYC